MGTPIDENGKVPVSVVSPKTILRAEINTATAGDNTIIAAPTAGSIRILHYNIQNTSAVDTTVILKGSASINGTGNLLVANGAGVMRFDAPGGIVPLVLTALAAFVINLSGANRHVGYVLYYVE